MILRGKLRRQVERITAEEWNAVNREAAESQSDIAPEVRADAAILRIRRRIFALHESEKFGSIWTTILISLAIRLAIKLIKSWLEDQVFSVEVSYHE